MKITLTTLSIKVWGQSVVWKSIKMFYWQYVHFMQTSLKLHIRSTHLVSPVYREIKEIVWNLLAFIYKIYYINLYKQSQVDQADQLLNLYAITNAAVDVDRKKETEMKIKWMLAFSSFTWYKSLTATYKSYLYVQKKCIQTLNIPVRNLPSNIGGILLAK